MASSTTTATTLSQLACFSSVNRQLQHRRHCVIPFPSSRSKLSITMTLERPGAESTGPEIKRVSAYSDDESILHGNGTTKLHSSSIDSTAQEPKSSPPKNAAKIHDFCLGIPFGGIIFGGGFIGFIMSRNPTALLFGGGILALSTLSLKIWSQGKSSLPFILGQIVLAAALLWKNMQTYSLTKKVFPTGFSAFLSAAMLCFYSYVIVSGGNPPPKKKKAAANVGVSS